MSELILKIIEVLLVIVGEGFKKKYFDRDFGNCHGHLRLNSYSSPLVEEKEKEKEEKLHEKEVEGLGIHTDASWITILYQDQSGGLQFRSSNGKWVEVSPCSETLVVNVGDLLQAWSNDRLRSLEHRVILKNPSANPFSVAYFLSMELGKLIFSPEDVVGDGNRRNYRPFVNLDYLKYRGSKEKTKYATVGFNERAFAGASE